MKLALGFANWYDPIPAQGLYMRLPVVSPCSLDTNSVSSLGCVNSLLPRPIALDKIEITSS